MTRILKIEDTISYHKGYITKYTGEVPEIIGIVKKPYRSFFRKGLNILNSNTSERNTKLFEVLITFITYY